MNDSIRQSDADFQEIQRLKAGQDRVLRLRKETEQKMVELKEEIRKVSWSIKDELQGATLSIATKRKFEALALRLDNLKNE